MKRMTCKQLGGACDVEFHAETFEEMGEQSNVHAMDMVQKGDVAHTQKMDEMGELMEDKDAFNEWYTQKEHEFNALPDTPLL